VVAISNLNAASRALRQVTRFFRRKKLRIFEVAWALSIVAVAILGPYVAPFDPRAVNLPEALQPPSREHLFGTDDMGRDLLSRVLAGAPLSIAASVIIVLSAVVIGIALGLTAGFYGGAIDMLAMRLADIFLSFPFLVLAMALAAALGPSLSHAVTALALIWWPPYARLIRAQVLVVREKDYVLAAKAVGAGNLRVMLLHILPSSVGPALARMTTDLGYAILATSSLGFVGLGAQAPTPEWGAIISQGRTYFLDSWWYATFAGLAISFAVMGFAFLGDEIHEAYAHL